LRARLKLILQVLAVENPLIIDETGDRKTQQIMLSDSISELEKIENRIVAVTAYGLCEE